MWCLFPPIGTCFLACKHFLLADTFVTNACFYRFFPHQTRSKRDGNVCKKAWWTVFIISLVKQLATHEHPQIPIPLCCPRVSGSPQTGTDSVWTRSVSLIHNSQFRCTGRDRTAGKKNPMSFCTFTSLIYIHNINMKINKYINK